MKLSTTFALAAIATATALPMVAPAQSWPRRNDDRHDSRYNRSKESDRRQQKKNEWRNIAIGAGALGVLGLLKGDKILTIGGAAGAVYSLHRYEQDRKSQNSLDRARSRYDGRTVKRNGQ